MHTMKIDASAKVRSDDVEENRRERSQDDWNGSDMNFMEKVCKGVLGLTRLGTHLYTGPYHLVGIGHRQRGQFAAD